MTFIREIPGEESRGARVKERYLGRIRIAEEVGDIKKSPAI